MLKRYLSFAIVLLLVLSLLSSCAFGVLRAETNAPTETVPADPLDVGDALARVSRKKTAEIGRTDLVFDLTRREVDLVYEKIERLERLLEAGEDFESFDALFTEVYETELDRIDTQDEIIYILWCCDLSDPLTEAAFLAVDEIMTDLLARLNRTYGAIWDSPFRDSFFDGWTPEEISLALRNAAAYTDEMTALKSENNDLLVAFRALSDKDKTFDGEAARLFLEMAKNNARIAELLGYGDYIEYAYAEIYTRDFAPAETAAFRTYFRDGLMPLLSSFAARFDSDNVLYLGLSIADYFKFYRFLAGDIRSDFSEVVARYAAAVGEYAPAYFAAYTGFKTEKNYCFAEGENALDGAFTSYLSALGTPFIYFGEGYFSPDSFLHEFGHYYAAKESADGAESISFDLAETQSQGNEFLFTYWFENCDDGLKKVARAVAEYKEYEILTTVLNASLVNDFEIYVYSHLDELTPDALDGILISLCDGYGGYDVVKAALGYAPESYWRHVVMESPGYYISYAVSSIPTLALYAKAKNEGFAAAVAAYQAVATASGEAGFLGALEAAGIGSPFSRATYTLIAAALGADYATED